MSLANLARYGRYESIGGILPPAGCGAGGCSRRIRASRNPVKKSTSSLGNRARVPYLFALSADQTNRNLPCRQLGVFLLADEINVGRADVGVAGELAHLLHRSPVADDVVDRRRLTPLNRDPVGINLGQPLMPRKADRVFSTRST